MIAFEELCHPQCCVGLGMGNHCKRSSMRILKTECDLVQAFT